MRWALNKFYYTQQKQTLTTAYTMMLKAKYTDKDGKLLHDYPSFTQFRYYFRKTRDKKKEYISRDGLKNYQRNNRPLLGDGVREYAPAPGIGMIDSTIADVYLVDNGGKLIGRPIITACVDAYSGLCLGYSLGWEGGVYSLKGLMLNIIADKKSWCQDRGIFIESEDWPCHQLPGVFCCDRGSEYISENFSNICECGCTISSLPSFRPELKSQVERWFGSLQDLYKPYLKGRGYVEKDANERGVSDYRLDACLTLRDFEKIMLHCIIYLNSLTSEVVCKMAGSYYEKEKSYSQSNRSSTSTSYKQKQILLPEDLNQLGDDAILLISNHGYVRTNKQGSAYYCTEPFKSQCSRIAVANKAQMDGV